MGLCRADHLARQGLVCLSGSKHRARSAASEERGNLFGRSERAASRPASGSIDQNNIDASLASLPIFLSGCKKLLILHGAT